MASSDFAYHPPGGTAHAPGWSDRLGWNRKASPGVDPDMEQSPDVDSTNDDPKAEGMQGYAFGQRKVSDTF